jgi:hypothetical protein
MSQSQVGSADASQAGGDGVNTTDTRNNQTDQHSVDEGSKNDHVSYSTYQKAVTREKSLKARANELEQRLQEIEQRDLENQKKYESLYRQEKERAQSLEQKLQGTNKWIEDQHKKTALRSELGKLGINPKYEDKALSLVNLSDLMVDDEHGVVGVEETARKFKEEFDVFFTKGGPGVRHSAPDSEGVSKSMGNMGKKELYEQLAKMTAGEST